MAVAVPVSPPDQHSPRLGHRASSQTVCSFSSRSLALMAAYLAPPGTVSFIHLGLGSGRFRVPTSTEYVKSPSDGASACSRARSSASRPADGGADGGEDTDESRVWRSDGVEEMQREGAWVRARAREAARWRRPCMAAAPAAAVGPWCGVGTAAVGDEMELFGEDVEERIRWKRNIGERFGHWKTYSASDLGAPLGGQLA